MSYKTLVPALLATLVVFGAVAATYGGGDVWTDPKTGLNWQVKPTGGPMGWADAAEHCQKLTLDGARDWRLPTISELRSVIRGCPETQLGGSCGVTSQCAKAECVNEACRGREPRSGLGVAERYAPAELLDNSGVYWSSSVVAEGGFAWYVSFDTGRVGYSADTHEVRCVR